LATDRVELSTAIQQLRREVEKAAETAKKEKLKFTLESIDLELTVVAEDGVEGGAEVGWWIFKAKAGVSAKDSTTHKVTLKLTAPDIQVGSSRKTA
jgi:hypothetical protein